VGVGSTFTVTLRNVRVSQAPSKSQETEDRVKRLACAPSRVLIVDDSTVNRTVLKALLSKCGVQDVVMAANGREAMETLDADPKIDLVFSDLWMPELDGYGLVRAIRSVPKLSRLPVYLVTADVEARKHAESSGFTDILLKPITLDKLKTLFESA